MGAWGKLAFDNDHACDWAADIGYEKASNAQALKLIDNVFKNIEKVGNGDLDAPLAEEGLAACEVLARLRGNFGYENAYTEALDNWVRASKLIPSADLLSRANTAIDSILRENSELRGLWEEDDGDEWRATIEDLRARLLKK